MEYVIEVKRLYKYYRVGEEVVKALNGVDFRIRAGEFCAIVGTSGSGKSTLLNMLAGLEKPTRGEIVVGGKHLEHLEEDELVTYRRENIGFIFQSFFLMQRQTALENVKMPLMYGGVPDKEQDEKALHMLERVGLGDKVSYFPNQMSGGQQQRVAIARAMCNNPSILLADEPTGALDQKTGRRVMELFHELNEEGRTIIMITHDIHIAEHAGRIVRILDGNIGEGALEDA